MQLQKTDKARAELKPGKRVLNQRERSLLLMADGNKTLNDFSALYEGAGLNIARTLLDGGYLEIKPIESRKVDTQPAPMDSRFFESRPAPLGTKLPLQPPAIAFPQIEVKPEAKANSTASSADNFEGKRSLATTRMFLFDICERMFTRRNPEMADVFREALRNAKDRETMLAVSRDMIEQIEIIAGHERADSISERIAMLLPSEQTA